MRSPGCLYSLRLVLNNLTDFQEILYARYTTGVHLKLVHFLFSYDQ
jgi:hypothetical protein